MHFLINLHIIIIRIQKLYKKRTSLLVELHKPNRHLDMTLLYISGFPAKRFASSVASRQGMEQTNSKDVWNVHAISESRYHESNGYALACSAIANEIFKL